MRIRAVAPSILVRPVRMVPPVAGLVAALAGGVVAPAASAQAPADRYSSEPAPVRVDVGITAAEANARAAAGWRAVGISRNPRNNALYDIAWIGNVAPYLAQSTHYFGMLYQNFLVWQGQAPQNERIISLNMTFTSDLTFDFVTTGANAGQNLILPAINLDSPAQFGQLVAVNGLRPLELTRYTNPAGTRYGGSVVGNSGTLARDWRLLSNVTEQEIAQQLGPIDHRFLDITYADPTVPTFNVISVPRAGMSWAWFFNETRDTMLNKAASARMRIIDLDSRRVNGQDRYLPLAVATSNDLAANAIPVGTGIFTSSTLGTTPDGQSTCGTGFNSDVWYVFTPRGRGTLRIGACGGAAGPVLVSTYGALPATTQNQTSCATGNANSSCFGGNGSSVEVLTERGRDVIIRVATPAPAGFTLSMSFFQSNPTCGAATPVAGDGAWAFGNVDGGTPSGLADPNACGSPESNNIFHDVWFRWTPTKSGVATLSVCDANFDTKMAVYLSCPLAPGTSIACNDDAGGSCGTRSRIVMDVVAGREYRVRVGGKTIDDVGDGTLTAGVRCFADFNADDELTFDDVQLFIGAYNAQANDADLNRDGEWTFDDIQLFVTLYNAGC